jgi:hypothetical protein
VSHVNTRALLPGGDVKHIKTNKKISMNTCSRPMLPMPHTTRCLHLQVGAGFWLTEPSVAKQQAEALARWQYSKAKDPHDCALLYLALGRKAVLQGLFKSAGEGVGCCVG